MSATKTKSIPEETVNQLSVRPVGRIHWAGAWALFHRESFRFLKISTQTVFAPTITTLLYLAIFYLALGGDVRMMGDVPFIQFLVPGLIMMSMLQNAFANTSTSILISKIQGNIVDTLMPPLGAPELTIGYGLSGMMRGLAVGFASMIVITFFVEIPFASPLMILVSAINGSLMMSLIGVIGGIWSEKFDQNALLTNFIITPLAFLSGTFYSIERLPPIWQDIAHLNPFFYVIDGMRYGFLGASDTDPVFGMTVVAGLNILLGLLTYRMFATGYKLKF